MAETTTTIGVPINLWGCVNAIWEILAIMLTFNFICVLKTQIKTLKVHMVFTRQQLNFEHYNMCRTQRMVGTHGTRVTVTVTFLCSAAKEVCTSRHFCHSDTAKLMIQVNECCYWPKNKQKKNGQPNLTP